MMEMAECPVSIVLACQVDECSYNEQKECRAGEIKVGDEHAMCDTFTTGQVNMQPGDPQVMQCLVDECKYNPDGHHCQASGISLGHHGEHADCDTFVPQR